MFRDCEDTVVFLGAAAIAAGVPAVVKVRPKPTIDLFGSGPGPVFHVVELLDEDDALVECAKERLKDPAP